MADEIETTQSAALTDVLGNQVPIIFDNLPSASGHITSGKLRALGVTTAERAPSFPDVPAIAEAVVVGVPDERLGHRLAARGFTLAGVRQDTAIAGYLLRPGQRGYALEDVYQRHLERQLPEGAGAVERAAAILELSEALTASLQEIDDLLGRLGSSATSACSPSRSTISSWGRRRAPRIRRTGSR